MTRKEFPHWFRNTFWYHYKWHTIAILSAALMVVSFIVSMLNRELPDFSYVLAYEGVVGEISTDVWDDLARTALSDINGDGKVVLFGQALCFDDASELGYASRVKFMTQLADDSLLLFVLDEATLRDLDRQGEDFLPLSELGLPAESDRPWLLRVEPPALLRELGVDSDFYLCIKALPPKKRDRPETQALYEQAAVFANIILETS